MELIDYGARWYDPQIGRFISPDTIIPGPQNPQNFNRYAYVLNNSLRYTDPTGHQSCAADDQACWDTQWYRARGYEQKGGEWEYTGSFLIDKDNNDFYTNGVQDAHKIKNELGYVALSTYERYDSVEAMARVTELAAALTGDENLALFMEYVSPVFTGLDGTGIEISSDHIGTMPENEYFTPLDNKGFALDYRDPVGHESISQARHVWFYTQVTHYSSIDMAFIGNLAHETIYPLTRQGKSIQDLNAGNAGIGISFRLKLGVLSPSGTGQYIRDTFGVGQSD